MLKRISSLEDELRSEKEKIKELEANQNTLKGLEDKLEAENIMVEVEKRKKEAEELRREAQKIIKEAEKLKVEAEQTRLESESRFSPESRTRNDNGYKTNEEDCRKINCSGEHDCCLNNRLDKIYLLFILFF